MSPKAAYVVLCIIIIMEDTREHDSLRLNEWMKTLPVEPDTYCDDLAVAEAISCSRPLLLKQYVALEQQDMNMEITLGM